MPSMQRPDRRAFLETSTALLAAGAAASVAQESLAQKTAAAQAPEGRERGQAGGAAPGDVLRSQPLPEPPITLPTDALPPPIGPKKRIAAITTAYFRYSHADDIITKFIEGYTIVGRTHLPHCDVVSLYIEQVPDTDIGRPMAVRYGIPVFDSPAGALTLGGAELAVDGVLLIGEHGDYPINEKGQQLYPRRRLFEQIVDVFRTSGRSVPVYLDKHFSYSWSNAEWMYGQTQELNFPMMAGSSVPVTWRKPPLALRQGVALESALAVGFSGEESYGFHTLELLQTFVERRQGGEVGVRSVQALAGEAAWKAAQEGRWPAALLSAAVATVPGPVPGPARDLAGIDKIQAADPNAVVFLVEYSDGFTAAAYLSRGLVEEFCFAAQVHGQTEPLATWCPLLKPQRDHFSFLCNHIEVMFHTRQASYPVERTYLVTGVLAALMDSHYEGGRRIDTPHLAKIGYTPAPELTT